MPVYPYKCRVCNFEFEIEQKITDEPMAECPECRVCGTNRLIAKNNFTLKGSGWAADSYTKKE